MVYLSYRKFTVFTKLFNSRTPVLFGHTPRMYLRNQLKIGVQNRVTNTLFSANCLENSIPHWDFSSKTQGYPS